jgi:DNA-binding HxlR family transcriptional regulator
MGTEGDLSFSEIMTQLPSVSEQLIKKVLQQLKAQGRLRLTGHGRSARWEKVD